MAEEHDHVWVLRSEHEKLAKGLDELARGMSDFERKTAKAEAELARFKTEQGKATDESKKLKSGLDGVGQAGAVFGGRIGGATAMLKGGVESMGKMSAAAGPLAAGLAGGTVAVAALGLAAFKGGEMVLSFARGAVEASKGIDDLMSAAEREAVGDVARDLDALDAATALATVQLLEAVPAVDSFVETLTGLLVVGGDVVDWFEELSDRTQFLRDDLGGVFDVLATIATGGGWLAIEGLTERLDEAAARGSEFRGEMEGIRSAAEDIGARPVRHVEELGDKMRAASAAAKEAKDSTNAWVTSMDALQSVADSAESDLVTPVMAANIAYSERAQIIAANAVDEEMATEAMASSNDRLARDLVNAWEPVPAGLEDSVGAMSNAVEDAGEDMIATLEEVAAKAAENAELIKNTTVDAWGSVGSLIQTVAQETIDALDQQLLVEEGVVGVLEDKRRAYLDTIDASSGASDAEREAARVGLAGIDEQIGAEKRRVAGIEERRRKAEQAAVAGFYVEQSAALAGIVMTGAELYAAMTLAFAYLGPFAPAAAAGVTLPLVAAQTAAVLTADPPTAHHDGGVIAPDELAVGGSLLRRSERMVVFNERAVQDGAADRAAEMNRPGGGGSGERVVLQDAGRTIAELWVAEADRPSSRLSRYLAALGR